MKRLGPLFSTRALVGASLSGVFLQRRFQSSTSAVGGGGGGAFTQQSKPARAFATELTKMRNDLRRSSSGPTPTKVAREECLRSLRAAPLECVQGLDARLVGQYLTVLEQLQVAGDDIGVQSAASWVQHQVATAADTNEQKQRLPIHQLTQCLMSLTKMRYEDSSQLLSLATPLIRASLTDASPSCCALLLECALHASHTEGSLVPLVADILVQLELRASHMSPTEMLQVGRLLVEFPTALNDATSRAVVASLLQSVAGALSSGNKLSLVDNVVAFSVALRYLVVASTDSVTSALAVLKASSEQIVQNELDLHSSPELLVSLLGAFSSTVTKNRKEMPAAINSDAAVVAAAGAVLSMVHRVVQLIDPQSLSLHVFCALYSAASFAAQRSQGLEVALSLPASSLSHLLPVAFEECLVAASNEANIAWTTDTLLHLLPALAVAQAHKPVLVRLCTQRLQYLADSVTQTTDAQRPSPSPPNVTALDIVPLLYPDVVEANASVLKRLLLTDGLWSPSSMFHIIVELASKPDSKPARALLRDLAPKVCPLIAKTTPTQLSIIAGCYGRTNVRHDELCDQISWRASTLADELSLHHITVILSALSAMEFRSNRAFLDLAVHVGKLCSRANEVQITNLIAAFAKALVWNFSLLAEMADRAFSVREGLTSVQMITILSSFSRLGFSHDDFVSFALSKLQHGIRSPSTSSASSSSSLLSLYDCVQLGFTASLTKLWTSELYDALADRFIADQQRMDAALLAEALFSFARVGLKAHRIFDATALRALAVAPSCPPLAMAHMVQAYAITGRRNEEMFGVFSDRLLAARETFPAVVIAAILDGFAQLGIEDDRLFIEMVPRVRHVATYGSPQDVANTVRAYSTAKLWHYKLFVRLAERGIQIKGECRAQDMIDILSSYARVEMRYEKLFVEFAPKLQTLAHMFTPSDMHALITAYGKVKVFEASLLSTLSDRVVEQIDGFDDTALEEIMVVLREAAVGAQDVLEQAYAKRIQTKGALAAHEVASNSV